MNDDVFADPTQLIKKKFIVFSQFAQSSIKLVLALPSSYEWNKIKIKNKCNQIKARKQKAEK